LSPKPSYKNQLILLIHGNETNIHTLAFSNLHVN
jgi:hypothetical protein